MEQVSRFRRCRRLFAHSVSWCYLVFHTLFGNKMLYGINIGHHITSHHIRLHMFPMIFSRHASPDICLNMHADVDVDTYSFKHQNKYSVFLYSNADLLRCPLVWLWLSNFCAAVGDTIIYGFIHLFIHSCFTHTIHAHFFRSIDL